MVFVHKHIENDETIIRIYKYYPYRNSDGTRSEMFDNNSGLILDVKERLERGIEHFYNVLNPRIKKNITLCVVPSSESKNKDSGIRKLAQKLTLDNRIDATHCLNRHTTIQKAAHGGPRNEQVHIDSIKVIDRHLIENKVILLLDDVATTQSSIRACKSILLHAGAKQVFMLVLGNTTRE